jgi:hypothetical protein
MNIEHVHASKFDNWAMVADEFRKLMAAKAVTVNVHHTRFRNGSRPIRCSAQRVSRQPAVPRERTPVRLAHYGGGGWAIPRAAMNATWS